MSEPEQDKPSSAVTADENEKGGQDEALTKEMQKEIDAQTKAVVDKVMSLANRSDSGLKADEQAKLVEALLGAHIGKDGELKQHKFWNTQPVLQQPASEPSSVEIGPLDAHKTVEDVRKDPYPLPAGFYWDSINIADEAISMEVYNLLAENYVEDDDNMFRFNYPVEFLRWALQPPGYYKDWLVGVRQTSNNKLRGFISGVPVRVCVHGQMVKMAEINFLCVHKALRAKRLAPVLIKEVTRRVNLQDQWQAVYTAGVVIPTPVARCRYWHRTINPKKLIEIGFSSLAPRMTMARTIRLYKLPTETSIPGFRIMESKDAQKVSVLLNNYLKQFKVWIEFNAEEVMHWLYTHDGVVNSYVVENPKTKEITDFCSFYHIPSTVMKHPKYKVFNAAYSFYNVATSVTLTELMKDALISAANLGCDVFNCLDIMQNKEILEPLKFGRGDGNLQYYLYNYACPEMKPEDVGIVLL